MHKEAAIKIALRNFLSGRGQVAITRPSTNIASVSLGDRGKEFIFSEFNDDGDPATEAEHDTIYSALETIVSEHNA